VCYVSVYFPKNLDMIKNLITKILSNVLYTVFDFLEIRDISNSSSGLLSLRFFVERERSVGTRLGIFLIHIIRFFKVILRKSYRVIIKKSENFRFLIIGFN